jgi:hypothetical protein
LKDDYPEMEISLKGLIDDLGDGDRLVRVNTVFNAPKAQMHANFTKDYEAIHSQLEALNKLEALRNNVSELQQKLDRFDLENKENTIESRHELEEQIAVATASLKELQDQQNITYDGVRPVINKYESIVYFINKMDITKNNIDVSGGHNQVVVGNISGTVTNTIQQLRETNQPKAPKLAKLLEELQNAVETSSELSADEKQEALGYLNQIGEMSAKDPVQNKAILKTLLRAIKGVISEAASLIAPVKKIAAAILSIWQA